MTRPRQFSLSYLLLEIFWIALSLGFVSQAIYLSPSPDISFQRICLLLPAIAFAGAAVGGIFGRMTAGFLVTYALFVLGLLAAVAIACLFCMGALLFG